jgi:type I restriction enzyme S subunit
MEVKPGYKQTEVGVIPKDWDVKPMCDLFSFTGGLTASRDQLGTEGHLYLHYGDIHTSPASFIDVQKKYDDIPKLNIAIADVPKKSLLSDGDVVFVDASEDEEGASRHHVVINPCGIPFISGLHTIVAKPKCNSLNTGYKRHCFQSRAIKSQFRFYAVGTKVSGVSKTSIAKILLPIPPKAEQEAIAGALSDADALIESLEQLVAKKRQIKHGAMQQLLTGQKRLPGFTGQWETKRLGEVVNCSSSGIYEVERDSPLLIAMPVATTAQISNDDRWNDRAMQTRFFTAEQVKNYSVWVGDLIVVKSSGSAASIQSGKMILVDSSLAETFIFSNFLMRLRPRLVSAGFLYFFLTSSRIKAMLPSLCEASTYPNIRINEYLEIEVPIPKIEEQQAIAAILSDMDAEIAALEAKLAKAQQVKQGMMQELLTGRIRLV